MYFVLKIRHAFFQIPTGLKLANRATEAAEKPMEVFPPLNWHVIKTRIAKWSLIHDVTASISKLARVQ